MSYCKKCGCDIKDNLENAICINTKDVAYFYYCDKCFEKVYNQITHNTYFIDREELKYKINKIDIWNKNGLKVKKEILELLK